MPSINTQGFPAIASVRVGINWADVPHATHATVWRVDCVTGERTQLRPYVAYNANGYLLLSCGQAIFWDTEVPLDTCVYYCTQAQDASGNTITTAASSIITDTFSRTVAAGSWGTADTGQVWTIVSGTATDFSVTGTRGRMGITTVNQIHRAVIDGPVLNVGALVTFIPNVLATGASIDMNIVLRRDEVSNSDYRIIVRFNTTGLVDLIIGRVVNGGAFVTLGTVSSVLPYTAATQVNARFETWGSLIQARVWNATTPEPAAWTITLTDGTPYVTPAAVGLRSLLNAGNTNALPVNLEFDNLTVYDPCDTTQVVEQCSGNVTVASNGNLWLKDPVRPCHDQMISLCWSPPPPCDENMGIFFARLDAETYGNQTTNMSPVNARHPIPVVRLRSDAESTLTLVTKTFTDRDNLLTELEPGSPLLLQVPAVYGMPDRYMSIGNVAIARYHPDHRYEPRVATLPFVTVNRPAGPTLGICGAQVDDLCDTYATWTALAAAGLTFGDLIDGKASPDGPGVSFRIWSQIEATYATWLAVETAPNTWESVREG